MTLNGILAAFDRELSAVKAAMGEDYKRRDQQMLVECGGEDFMQFCFDNADDIRRSLALAAKETA